MNNLQRYTRQLVHWALLSVLLLPALVLAHGAVDIPVSRQVHCYTLPDFWNGSNDPACKGVYNASGTYPGQQWNEVAHLVKDYNDQAAVERAVPDGTLCAAGDPLKKGLDLPLSNWDKSTVTPKSGNIEVRLIGTAPHVPSFVKIYMSKPGYNAATGPLKWSDLQLVHEEQLQVARTDWGNQPPKISGASGFFKFNVAIPAGRSGDAVLFTRWQRIDPAGEGFYNCSDITINDASIPEQLFDKGPFIASDMNQLKVGDAVHFRILDNTPAAKEIVDITHRIDQSNLNPNIWGRQVAEKVGSNIARIGEKNGSNVVFNTANSGANSVYTTAEGYSKAMSIIPGGGETPVNPTAPVARITGPSTVQSGQSFTLSGQSSVGYNGPLLFQWEPHWQGGAFHEATVDLVAPTVTQQERKTVRLTVYDRQNSKNGETEVSITVNPAGGGDHPPYVPNGPHEAGKIYSHNGENYKCKQAPWCSGSPMYYEPGKGLAWQEAWDKL